MTNLGFLAPETASWGDLVAIQQKNIQKFAMRWLFGLKPKVSKLFKIFKIGCFEGVNFVMGTFFFPFLSFPEGCGRPNGNFGARRPGIPCTDIREVLTTDLYMLWSPGKPQHVEIIWISGFWTLLRIRDCCLLKNPNVFNTEETCSKHVVGSSFTFCFPEHA